MKLCANCLCVEKLRQKMLKVHKFQPSPFTRATHFPGGSDKSSRKNNLHCAFLPSAAGLKVIKINLKSEYKYRKQTLKEKVIDISGRRGTAIRAGKGTTRGNGPERGKTAGRRSRKGGVRFTKCAPSALDFFGLLCYDMGISESEEGFLCRSAGTPLTEIRGVCCEVSSPQPVPP